VHLFCCMLAYRLCSLLRYELRNQGLDMGLNRLLDVLSEKQQLIHYHQKKRGISETYSMAIGNDETVKIVKLLDLQRYQLGQVKMIKP
jgi:hypothetical protein